MRFLNDAQNCFVQTQDTCLGAGRVIGYLQGPQCTRDVSREPGEHDDPRAPMTIPGILFFMCVELYNKTQGSVACI